MDTRKDPPKSPVARETKGEGAPKRTRNEGTVSAEERAEPERGNEQIDAASSSASATRTIRKAYNGVAATLAKRRVCL